MAGPAPSASKDLPTAKGYTFIRALGDRPVPIYAAAIKGRKSDPIVIERFARDKSIHDEDVVEFMRGARAVAAAQATGLAPIREVVVDTDAILVVGEFIDGESLESLWQLGHERGLKMPLDIAIRIALDVLVGLDELHRLKDASGAALCMVHGELSPGNVLVQIDGKAKLTHVCRVKWAALKVATSVGYLAPELLLQEGDIDHRADIYSLGAIVFAAMSGVPPFPEGKVSSVIRKLASGAVPRLAVPKDEPWASALIDLVARAMSVDRVDRFDSARQIADALRKAAGKHVGTEAQVAAWVARLAGTRILARRNELAPPGIPRTRSHPPPAAHGLPLRAERPIPRPAVPSDVDVVAARPPEPVPMPEPVVGAPSRGPDKRSASKLAPPAPVPLPVSSRAPAPSPVPGGAPVPLPVPSGAPVPSPVPGGAPVPSPVARGAPASLRGAAPVPQPGPVVLPQPLYGVTAKPTPVEGYLRGLEESPTIEPLAADSHERPTKKRRVWVFAAAGASGLALLVIGFWILGSREAVESTGAPTAIAAPTQSATASIEPVAAAPPSTASDEVDAAPRAGDAPGATDERDAATDVADAGAVPPKAPTRPSRPSTRPRRGKNYDPMGI